MGGDKFARVLRWGGRHAGYGDVRDEVRTGTLDRFAADGFRVRDDEADVKQVEAVHICGQKKEKICL